MIDDRYRVISVFRETRAMLETNTHLVMKKFLLAITPAILVLIFGCGKSKTYETSDGKVTVDQKGETTKYEVTTKDGKATMTANEKGVAIPDTFPKDVPIPKGAVARLNMSQGKAQILHLHVSGNVADVAKEYSDKLKGEGWEIETTMNMGDGSMLHAKKGNRQCVAMVAKDDAGSLIQLTVNED